MIAAGVVLSIVVGYLAQPLVAQGARWLWRSSRVFAGTGLDITWQVVETIGEWSAEVVDLLNPWRRTAEVERKLAEVQCELNEAKLDLNLALIEVRTTGRLLNELRGNEKIQKMVLDEANRAIRHATEVARVL